MSDQLKKSFAVLLANSVLYPHAAEQVCMADLEKEIWAAAQLLVNHLDSRTRSEILRDEDPNWYEPEAYLEEQMSFWGTTYLSEASKDLKGKILAWHVLIFETREAIREIRIHVPEMWNS